MSKPNIAACLALFALTPLAPAQSLKPAEPAPVQTTSITRESLVGYYNGGQMEVGAQLQLKADGHFSYELAYGALDEAAEGTWEFKQDAVFLTTVPAVVPPRFVVESDMHSPQGELWITVSNPAFLQGSRQRIYLIYGPNEQADMAQVGEDGRVALPGNRWPTAIIPEIPVYPIMAKPIPLTATQGHRIVMRFEPNDIGKANFHAARLGIEGGVLIMPRRDLQVILHFRRQDGPS